MTNFNALAISVLKCCRIYFQFLPGFPSLKQNYLPHHLLELKLMDTFHEYFGIYIQVLSQYYDMIPGSHIAVKYVKNSYQNDPIRVCLEIVLLIYTIKYIVQKRKSTNTDRIKLTKEEEDELVQEWKPEALVPDVEDAKIPIITGPLGTKVKIQGNNRNLINLISINPVGLLGDKKLIETARETVKKYAIGSCGPPGFYGTVDVHLELEQKIASFIGHHQAILYSQAFSAVSSVIPAFCKRGDIIICDEAVSFAIQKGVQISRSTVYFYRHNDMQDLERILKEVNVKARKKQLMRKFIITEGLFMNTAEICDLPQLLALKFKYKYRLIVDESLSFGCLGSNGKGVCQYYDQDPKSVDMIVGSLCYSLGLSGGFCCANDIAIDHQRLSGSSYVFSAALPPLFATAAIQSLIRLESKTDIFVHLLDNIKTFHGIVDNTPNIIFEGHESSPIIYLKIAKLPCSDADSPFKYVRACRGRASVLDVKLGSTVDMQEIWEAEVIQQPPILGIFPSKSSLKLPDSDSIKVGYSPVTAKFPITHRRDLYDHKDYKLVKSVLLEIIDDCQREGVLVNNTSYIEPQEKIIVEGNKRIRVIEPSIRICISSALPKKDVEYSARVIKNACQRIVKRYPAINLFV